MIFAKTCRQVLQHPRKLAISLSGRQTLPYAEVESTLDQKLKQFRNVRLQNLHGRIKRPRLNVGRRVYSVARLECPILVRRVQPNWKEEEEVPLAYAVDAKMSDSFDPTVEKHLKGHKDSVTGVCFHPETTRVSTCSSDRTLMVFNIVNSVRAYRFFAHKDAVLDLDYAPSGEVIASASRDRTVRIWVPTIKGESLDFRAHTGAVRSVQFSPDGKKLITASDDKSVKLWMVCRRRFLSSFVAHTNWVRRAKFSPDGRLIVSCADDKTIRLWDVSTGKCIKTFNELKDAAVDVDFHPSGVAIGCANTGGCVKLYELRTGSLHQHYTIHNGTVNKAVFHPNGNFMLTASDDSTMKILDLLEGRPIYTLKGHCDAVKSIAFSSGGEFFASGGADRQLLVWKSNFDRDDVARKRPRKLYSPGSELRLENDLSKTEKTSGNDDKYEDEDAEAAVGEDAEFLSDSTEDVDAESDFAVGKHWHGSVPDIPGERCRVEVINLRNAKPRESGRIAELPMKSRDSQASAVFDTLSEQVDSIRDTIVLLEQRITNVEDELKK